MGHSGAGGSCRGENDLLMWAGKSCSRMGGVQFIHAGGGKWGAKIRCHRIQLVIHFLVIFSTFFLYHVAKLNAVCLKLNREDMMQKALVDAEQ